VMTDLRQVFEFMTNTNTCVVALQEAEHYRRKYRSFSSELVAKMACDNNTSPGKQSCNSIHFISLTVFSNTDNKTISSCSSMVGYVWW
jgi:hypothetical protein